MYDIIEVSPSGNMIFLNSHVLGISWPCHRGDGHKILPTLYLLQGKQAAGDKGWANETENTRGGDSTGRWGCTFFEA